jgi:bifunctional DNA-binding transcriptional regulator/antitoxin component of YhaV-PrlF toxin-antitoxin module
MGEKDEKSSYTHKLTRIGKSSIGVIIPIEIARALGWTEKDRVIITRNGEKLIIRESKKQQSLPFFKKNKR